MRVLPFSEKATEAIRVGAQTAAENFDVFRCEYLLYGIAVMGHGTGADEPIHLDPKDQEQFLNRIKRQLQSDLPKLVSTEKHRVGQHDLHLERVLALAKEFARRGQAEKVGIKHLMLAMVRECHNGACQIMLAQGFKIATNKR